MKPTTIKKYSKATIGTPHTWTSDAPQQWSYSLETIDDTERFLHTAESIAASKPLGSAIESSRRILDLHINPDDPDSPLYAVETWNRMNEFLRNLEYDSRSEFDCDFALPTISAAEYGSIDLYWKLTDRTLLINIPQDLNERATFYGENAAGDIRSGAIALTGITVDICAWLRKSF